MTQPPRTPTLYVGEWVYFEATERPNSERHAEVVGYHGWVRSLSPDHRTVYILRPGRSRARPIGRSSVYAPKEPEPEGGIDQALAENKERRNR